MKIALLALSLSAVMIAAASGVNNPDKTNAPAAAVNDPVQHRYEQLLEMDEAALNECERMEKEAAQFKAATSPGPLGAVEL